MAQTVQTLVATTALPVVGTGVTPPALHYSLTVNNAGGAVTLGALMAAAGVTKAPCGVSLPYWVQQKTTNELYPVGIRIGVVTSGREVRVTFDGTTSPVVGASAVGDLMPENPTWYEFRNQAVLLGDKMKFLADVDATKLVVTFLVG